MGSRLVLGLLLIACLACGPKSSPASVAATSVAEGKAYVQYLKLSGVGMKATENFAGQVVTEIEGNITNAGGRTVEYAEVACIFYDSLNQLILREKVAIISRPLQPGGTRAFRLPFDDIPPSWNNQLPQVVIAQIRLG